MRVTVVAIVLSIAVTLSLAQQKKAIEPAGKANPEHGRYIAENVAMCIQCHSPREGNGNVIRSRAFGGAAIPVGKPSIVNEWAEYAPRIAGLPQYSEGQTIRLLTSGIGREGKPLRSPMPTFKMSHQDAEDVVAFLKSLE